MHVCVCVCLCACMCVYMYNVLTVSVHVCKESVLMRKTLLKGVVDYKA